MFDLTAETIDRPFRDPHAAASALSVASHVIALGSVAAVLLFSVSTELPDVPTVMAFVAELPAALPPPPPPPPAASQARTEKTPRPSPATPASGPTFTVPTDVPHGIQPESAVDFGDEGGEAGGVPGGIPGGVVGGIIMDAPPPLPPPPPRRPARVGGDIAAPALIHRVEPEYPWIAVSGKITGIVILEATVNEAGAVTDVTVLRSIPLLDKAAVAAVKQWRYEPLRLNGVPSSFILTVTLTFSLK